MPKNNIIWYYMDSNISSPYLLIPHSLSVLDLSENGLTRIAAVNVKTDYQRQYIASLLHK